LIKFKRTLKVRDSRETLQNPPFKGGENLIQGEGDSKGGFPISWRVWVLGQSRLDSRT
jgi:hypothetical protein